MNMAIFLFRTVIQACYSIQMYRKLCLGVMMRIATVVETVTKVVHLVDILNNENSLRLNHIFASLVEFRSHFIKAKFFKQGKRKAN